MYFEYAIKIKDFREAQYYGALMRNRKIFFVLLLMLPLAAAYLLGVIVGALKIYPLAICIFSAYVLFVLVIFGNIERSMFCYAKSKESLVGIKTRVKIEGNQMNVDIDSKDTHFSVKVSDLLDVIELKRIYLIYISEEQALIFPKESIKKGEGILPKWLAGNI
ncbi:MAG: YcxB family protein [Lachnospiraceae bacterium]|nr:YcxB family protein [Lachnospiraceae bacterium]